MRQRVILDVDTGTDDAIALMLAACHPSLDLVGVTTVSGSARLSLATENTLGVLAAVGSAAPVYPGMDHGLARMDLPIPRGERPGRLDVHGGRLDAPGSSRLPASQHAVAFLKDSSSRRLIPRCSWRQARSRTSLPR